MWTSVATMSFTHVRTRARRRQRLGGVQKKDASLLLLPARKHLRSTILAKMRISVSTWNANEFLQRRRKGLDLASWLQRADDKAAGSNPDDAPAVYAIAFQSVRCAHHPLDTLLIAL